jgi:hypothetical protein
MSVRTILNGALNCARASLLALAAVAGLGFGLAALGALRRRPG